MTSTKVVLIATLLHIACSQSAENSVDSTSLGSAKSATDVERRDQAAQSTDKKSPCPHTGQWAICSVERRLKQSGFVAKPVEGEAPQRLGFSVKPAVYTLGKARLEVFIYPDEAALGRDVGNLDTVEVAPKGATGSWEMRPLFIRSGNLAAVLLSENPRQAERLSLALTAGAPQPGSPR